MPDMDIASMDLAKGLKVSNFNVPPMLIDVVLKNPPTDLQKALKDDKLVIQKIIMASYGVLNKAKADFQSAATELDATFAKKPPVDEKEAVDRAKTLNVLCRQIADAQGKAATQAAEDEWKTQVRKKKNLSKYDGLFAARMTLGVISVAVSALHTALTFGATSAIAIATSAATIAGMCSDIHNHCRDMAKTEEDIIDTDKVLAKAWTNDKATAGKVGRELAAALGVPLVKSIGGLGTLLTEYSAKNARKDKLGDDLYKKAKELMKKIAAARKDVGPAMQKKLDAVGKQVDALLDRVGDLSKTSQAADRFAKSYGARYDIYRAMEGAKLGAAAEGTGLLVIAEGIVSASVSIVQVAAKLA